MCIAPQFRSRLDSNETADDSKFEPVKKRRRTLDCRDQATLYVDIGEPRRALEHLEVLRERVPDNAEVAVEMARVLHSLGSADKAEETLDEMMRCYPDKAKGRPAIHALRCLLFCAFLLLFCFINSEAQPNLSKTDEVFKREGVTYDVFLFQPVALG